MSEDEVVVIFTSGIVATLYWGGWWYRLVDLPRVRPRGGSRLALALLPLGLYGILHVALTRLAAHDVRDDLRYIGFYAAFGAAWIGVFAMGLMPWLGLSARDDVLERGNGPAVTAIWGGLLGVTFAFAGGNVGDGPGWWVVLFSSGLATLVLKILWWAHDNSTHILDRITVERDGEAALRFAGLMSGAGLIAGRAAAGNWVSAGATIEDFMVGGWPLIPLGIVAAALERRLKPRPGTSALPMTFRAVLPALAFVATGAVWIVVLGEV